MNFLEFTVINNNQTGFYLATPIFKNAAFVRSGGVEVAKRRSQTHVQTHTDAHRLRYGRVYKQTQHTQGRERK